MSGRDGIYRYSMAVPEDPGSIPDGSARRCARVRRGHADTLNGNL